MPCEECGRFLRWSYTTFRDPLDPVGGEVVPSLCTCGWCPQKIVYAHQGSLLKLNWLPIDKMKWDVNGAEASIREAFKRNSETDLLEVLRNNSFLFYGLVRRKYGVQPIFHEVRLGAKLRCDFAWVNDHSYGPEWVLVEVEKPEMELFTQKGDPTYQLNHAIEQVRSWDRYFEDNPGSKKEIFGAVHSFRFMIVGGRRQDWQKESHECLVV